MHPSTINLSFTILTFTFKKRAKNNQFLALFFAKIGAKKHAKRGKKVRSSSNSVG